MEEVGGDVLASTLCSGPFALRYRRARKESFQQELPACNLLVRKPTFEQLGGFDATFMTAEDSKLCFQINETGHKVLYSPDVIVYHYRRPLFLPHLRQISRYARDKARLVRQGVSWGRLIYTVPSLFVLSLIGGILLGIWSPLIQSVFAATLLVYGALIVVSYVTEIQKWSLPHFLLFTAAIPLTHITYGVSFIMGLLMNDEEVYEQLAARSYEQIPIAGE
jgi:cellulose synthase/poly-beta-1,6-N-acetylglucosamine synthase-like glycosyltransferase